jgi:hypothetical protein
MKRLLAHMREWSKRTATTTDIILAVATTIVGLLVGMMVLEAIRS